MQKINSNNLTSKLVKCLINTSNIVTAPIWKQGQPAIKDMIYVTKDFIVRAKKEISTNLYGYENIDINNTEYFEKISPFIEGNFYNALTSNYMSNTGLYDSVTHYFLGQYLRQLRDLHDINLMPYYNCWDGTSIDSYRIVKDAIISDANARDYYKLESNSKLDGYKLLLIPVKFNKKYTLYANSDTPIKFGFAYYDGIQVLSDIDSSTGKPYNKLVGSNSTNIIDYVSYSKPVVIESPKVNDIFDTYKLTIIEGLGVTKNVYLEDYLVMFLQIPSDNVSSVVVLEGDYTLNRLINTQTEVTSISDGKARVEYRKLDDSTNTLTYRLPQAFYVGSEDFSGDDFIKSPSSLVMADDTNSYLFNSRLLEYLLDNVITWDDTISKDILYAHEDVSTRKCAQLNGLRYSGSDFLNYSDDFREFIYGLATTNIKSPVLTDVNGFIDKDTEDIIIRGRDRDISKWGT